jgi:hypothetical protein
MQAFLSFSKTTKSSTRKWILGDSKENKEDEEIRYLKLRYSDDQASF